MCTSPERVSEEFSNQFLFARVVFGVVLFKNAAVFQSWIRLGVEAESGWVVVGWPGGGSRFGVHKKVFLMIEPKICVLHRNVFLKSLATSFCLPGSILELFCSKSWLALKSGFAGLMPFGEVEGGGGRSSCIVFSDHYPAIELGLKL